MELKKEGTILNVRGCDRGLLVTYKDPQEKNSENLKTRLIRCEQEIDELRLLMKVSDAHISVSEKYTEEFWIKKQKPEMSQKRKMEDEFEQI